MCARNNSFIFLQYFRGADSSGKAFKYMFIYLIELIKQKPNNLEQFTIWKKQNLCLLFTFFMGGSRSWSRSRSRGRQKGGGWAVAYHCFVTLIFESFIFPLVWRPVCEPDIYKRKTQPPRPLDFDMSVSLLYVHSSKILPDFYPNVHHLRLYKKPLLIIN